VVSLLLILQSDIDTLGVIIVSAFIMFFISGAPKRYIFSLIALAVVGFGLLIYFAPYRLHRLLVFLNPSLEPMGIGYHIKQSIIFIGSGGTLGQGFENGILSGISLPEVISDSIFTAFSQTTGFVGSFILILLFLIFMWRGFKISQNSADKFKQLMGIGITSWISFQSFINVGSMIGIIPLSGITLPFLSYGGTSLVIVLIAVGILLNISKSNVKKGLS